MNAAIIATILRVVAIPVFIAIYYSSLPYSNAIASVIFVLACITDWLDGYLARKLNQASKFGAFLDPVADKLLVVVALVMLCANFSSPWFVAPAAIMVAREVLISALREWMAENNARDAVAVGFVGKIKTTVQMVAIAILLAAGDNAAQWFILLGYITLYVSAVFALWSMTIYLKSAWPMLTAELK